MRHRKAGKKLGRNPSHRRALLRNMVTSLFKYEQIETTEAKAKSVRPVAEKMITLAKQGDLHARRQALAYMKDKQVTHRLFDELKDRYVDRQGGFIRIVKKGVRKGDGAPMSIVQLLPQDEEKKSVKKRTKKAGVSKAKETKSGKEAAVDTKEKQDSKETAAAGKAKKTAKKAGKKTPQKKSAKKSEKKSEIKSQPKSEKKSEKKSEIKSQPKSEKKSEKKTQRKKGDVAAKVDPDDTVSQEKADPEGENNQ